MTRATDRAASLLAKAPLGERLYEHLSSTYIGVRGIEGIDRTRWLYRPGANVPKGSFIYRKPKPVGAVDVELCERLIAAYERACNGNSVDSGMWNTDVFQSRHSALVNPLRDRNPEQLAEALASMFRLDIVIGMATGSVGVDVRSRIARRMFWLWILGKMTSVAESFGAARLENPEQGEVGVGLKDGLQPVVEASEAALGISLNFPDVGSAYGIEVAGRLFTTESPDLIYGATRLLEAIELFLPESTSPRHIVEIGGGYGGMAYWVAQLDPAPYTIVDLPLINVLQGYFLGQALGHDKVSLYGEGPAQISIVPDHAIAEIPAPFDVLANKDSMPEIPRDALMTYLNWAKTSCSGLFYSYNQEAAAVFEGETQNVVADALAEIGGFRRVRRDLSWLRRGYAEEIFLKDGVEP